jgi:cytochrome c oxidase cbb3-type subunit 3
VPRGAPPPAAAPTARAADKAKGKEIYTTTCVVCHGENGKGGTHGGAPFTPKLTHESVVNVLRTGRNDMPPFGSALSPEALQDLTAYVLELAGR